MERETLQTPVSPATSSSEAPSSVVAAGPNGADHNVADEHVENSSGGVSFRCFLLGLFLVAGLSALNVWIEMVANVHFLGGIHMPFGAIFGLLFLILFVNGPLRYAQNKIPAIRKILPPFCPAELLTLYAMMLFAALISTAGTESFFITTAPALFYFSTRENRWADLFYKYVPSHFAPGWDGKVYQRQVIEPFFTGGLNVSEVPWHAWSAMLISWIVLLLLVYSTLFFIALLLRRQWIENEALTFPLVQLPLQMVDTSGMDGRPGEGFWQNRLMWGGFAIAAVFHFLRGMNNYFPDWPMISSFQGNDFAITFTESPWNAVGSIGTPFYFGAIGVAYLLTRELSFSFWFFFLMFKLQLVMATMAGFPVSSLPKDAYLGQPLFISWQSTGGWFMMGALLLWSARGHLQNVWIEAINPGRAARNAALSARDSVEPFSARVMLVGFLLSIAGLMYWCFYAGINPVAALGFFAMYALVSIVLARLVVEGGFLFPQLTFAPLEVITSGFMSAKAIGAESITRLAFVQPMLYSDMRTNLLPAFLHTLKISHDLKLDRRHSRRVIYCIVFAVLFSVGVSTFISIATIYNAGGLKGYTWATVSGPQMAFTGAENMLRNQPTVNPGNWIWMAVGGALVWGMVFARGRFLWFPLHPLAYIVSSGYPITRLWASFFIGWLVKTLLLRYGGQEAAARTRPFMIGLILGNATAMVIWMLYGFIAGTQIEFWPA